MCLVFTCAHLYIKNRGSHRKLLPVFPGNLTTSLAPQSAQPRIPWCGICVADEGSDKEWECSHPVCLPMKPWEDRLLRLTRELQSWFCKQNANALCEVRCNSIPKVVVLTLYSGISQYPDHKAVTSILYLITEDWSDPGIILMWACRWSWKL
jgi:hypothetical protein